MKLAPDTVALRSSDHLAQLLDVLELLAVDYVRKGDVVEFSAEHNDEVTRTFYSLVYAEGLTRRAVA